MSAITDQNRAIELREIRETVDRIIENDGGRRVVIHGSRDDLLVCTYYPREGDDEGGIEFRLRVEHLTPNQAAVIAAREGSQS